MNYVIGIDSGTTGTKVILFDSSGKIVSSSYAGYGVQARGPDEVEQNPNDWWTALVKGVRQVSRHVQDKDHIRALSLSTQGATFLPLGKNGYALCPAITWLDKRAKAVSRHLAKKLGRKHVFRTTGKTPDDWTPLAKMVQWRVHDAAFYRQVARIVFVNDYLIHRLTGEYVCDPSNGAMTAMLDIAKKDWADDILAETGIDPNLLSPVRPSGEVVGTLLPWVCGELGLSRHTLVVNGGHDQYCAAIGAGVIRVGECMLSCGTAWAIVCPTRQPVFDPLMRLSPGVYVTGDKFGLMGAMTGNSVFDAVRKIIGIDDPTLKSWVLEKQLRARRDRHNGLIFLPHFFGVSYVKPGSGYRGGFVGLNLTTDRIDMLLSMMQGIAFEARSVMEILRELKVMPKRIRMIGGAARSAVWAQIVADVLEREIEILDSPEAACRGAAMLAAAGAGLFKTIRVAGETMSSGQQMLRPDRAQADYYRTLFKEYRKISLEGRRGQSLHLRKRRFAPPREVDSEVGQIRNPG